MDQLQNETIQRIRQMEQYFDTLCAAAAKHPETLSSDPVLREMLQDLTQYYESKLWLEDYELDEKGCLPADLKRGVLSQDGVYNLLAQICPPIETEEGTTW